MYEPSMTMSKLARRRPRTPYAWLGAGALGVGVWAALAAGAGVAHAEGPAADSSGPSSVDRGASATANTGVLQLDATRRLTSAGPSPGDVQTRQTYATSPSRRMRRPPAPRAVSDTWSVLRLLSDTRSSGNRVVVADVDVLVITRRSHVVRIDESVRCTGQTDLNSLLAFVGGVAVDRDNN